MTHNSTVGASDAIHRFSIFCIGSIPRLGALLLIGASATIGTLYAYKLGQAYGTGVALAFAAMALGGELLKPIAVERAFDAGWRSPLRMLSCALLAVVAIAYSLAGELAFSAGSRGDAVAQREAGTDAKTTARAAAKRAGDELARLKPARPVAELEALVAGAKQVCRVEVDQSGRRTVCSKPPALVAELGRAKRRAELEAQVLTAEGRQVSAPTVGEADPLSASVVHYLEAMGITATVADVATWLHLLPVLLLEVGSAFGLLVARNDGKRPTIAQVAGTTVATDCATIAQAASVPAPVATVANVASVATIAAPLPAPNQAPAIVARRAIVARPAIVAGATVAIDHCASVRAALQAAGRPLSNVELAATMGVHPSTASRHVARLQMLGAVHKLQAGREVVISLVH